jgi:carbamoyl-phosphate synthase small subunit
LQKSLQSTIFYKIGITSQKIIGFLLIFLLSLQNFFNKMAPTHTANAAYLLLADGTLLQGKSFGYIGTTAGEICFNTGMTGYQEVFTDPSYYGQVIIMNAAHIGNYGVKDGDVESDSVKVKGVVARNLEELYSRNMAQGNLHDYLTNNKIVGIEGVDTRALVSHIREKGAMNCIISSEISDLNKLKELLHQVPSMDGLELASVVTTEEAYTLGDENAAIRIAVLDYGTKRNILQCMVERGAFVKVFPAKTTAAEVREFKANGYFISNGPGDPSSMPYAITAVQDLLKDKIPTFGICLGHQLLALANGVSTFKMSNGHRGLNHPVLNLITGKSEITTQNHGFGVDPKSILSNENIEITHRNLNDDSIEGIRLKNLPAFSVQYHPEATPGPHDSRYLFDDFMEMIKETL